MGNGGASVGLSVLDSTEIRLSFSGSINTIGGFGSVSGLMELPSGATLEAFSVEMVTFNIVPGIGSPDVLILAFGTSLDPPRGFDLAWDNPALQPIGSALTVSPAADADVFEGLKGYIVGSRVPEPIRIASTLHWPFGGLDVGGEAVFAVVALGEVGSMTVATPPALVLMVSALSLMGWRQPYRRRREARAAHQPA